MHNQKICFYKNMNTKEYLKYLLIRPKVNRPNTFSSSEKILMFVKKVIYSKKWIMSLIHQTIFCSFSPHAVTSNKYVNICVRPHLRLCCWWLTGHSLIINYGFKNVVQNQKSKCLKILVLKQQSRLLPSDLSLHQPLNVKINQDSMPHKDLRREQTFMQCKVGIP